MLTIANFYTQLLQRLRKKLIAALPIIIAAAMFTVILTVFIYVAEPFLPEQYQRILQQLQNGDWASSRDTLTQLLDDYGEAKSYVFLGLQTLQVIFAPIPGQLIGLLGGYLFGFWHGLLLTMLGLAIGSFVAMGLGRLFGKRVVRRFVPQALLEKFDYLASSGGLWNFFMMFLLPALPDDAICFIAGLTRLRLSHLLLVCLLGRLPGMAVLVFVGSSVGGSMVIANTVFAVAMIVAFGLWLYSDEAEAYFHRKSMGRVAPKGK